LNKGTLNEASLNYTSKQHYEA